MNFRFAIELKGSVAILLKFLKKDFILFFLIFTEDQDLPLKDLITTLT